MTKNKKPTDEEILLEDANERFVGDTLDEKKMERLNAIRALCVGITNETREIRYKAYPFTNRDINGSASLTFNPVYFCTNTGVSKKLSEAFALADAFITTTLQGDLKITFLVHDMWTEFHYED